jgi:hypothetical protein
VNQATTYLQALAASLTINVIIPLLAFVVVFGLFVWVLFRAQKGGNFDAAEFLRDDKGKLSKGGLFAFVACSAHTWALMVETINARLTWEFTMIYALTWSGSLVLLEGIKAWQAKPTS